jgi:hypothetical protein
MTLTSDQRADLEWRKSSFSGQDTAYNCVEAAPLPAGMALRDSKNPDGPAFAFSGRAWAGLVAAVRGEPA